MSTRGSMLPSGQTRGRGGRELLHVVASPAPPRNLRHAGMACESARTCLSCCMWPTDDQSEVPHPFAPSLKHFPTSSCRETATRGEKFLCTCCCMQQRACDSRRLLRRCSRPHGVMDAVVVASREFSRLATNAAVSVNVSRCPSARAILDVCL